MFKKLTVSLLVCLVLPGLLFAGQDAAEKPTPAPEVPAETTEAPPAAVETDVPTCPALPEVDGVAQPGGQPADKGWDPATCGTCQGYCSSDNLCAGKLLGDKCDNSNRTCQARTGCALFNCCACR